MIDPPPGWHVAPDAPGTLQVAAKSGLSGVTLEVIGDPSVQRLPVPEEPFVVFAAFALCRDSGTTCRPVSFNGEGGGTSRGVVTLAPVLALASTAGKGDVAGIYDFTAVWCPPCTLLAAEVLYDPAHAELLALFPITPVDVDRKESWDLKDRYAVTGYPTLVAVDAAGREVGRLIGYPGEAATLDWIASLGNGPSVHELLSTNAGITGAAASRAARQLAEAGHTDAARRYLAQAGNDLDAHIARLLVDKSAASAAWLLESGPPGGEAIWLYAAVDLVPERWKLALPRMSALDPADAAGLFDRIAEHLGGDAALALRVQAIALVRAAFTGDDNRDRAYIGTLADLYAATGQLESAVALCATWSTKFPTEFTYDHVAARLLVDASRPADAEPFARTALARAWGDQRLRAVVPLARALAGQGKRDEALAILDTALQENPEPPLGTEVRTTRYRTAIQDLRTELASAHANPSNR